MNARIGVTIRPGESDAAALKQYTVLKARDRKFCYHDISDYRAANCLQEVRDARTNTPIHSVTPEEMCSTCATSIQQDRPVDYQYSLHWMQLDPEVQHGPTWKVPLV